MNPLISNSDSQSACAGELASGGETAYGPSAIAELFSQDSDTAQSAQEYRFKCLCAYDGTDFCGWQSQASGGSIQDYIERRLYRIFKRPVRVHGSGRTDAGVHANAQVFHFDAPWKYDCRTLMRAMSSTHNLSLNIYEIKRVSKNFHARYSAKGKRYVYRIYEGRAMPQIARFRWSLASGIPLDIDAMNDAAKIFIGEHDFTAFSASRGPDAKKVDPVKRIYKLELSRKGRELRLTTEGSGYLYRMVRMLSGALVGVGRGKIRKSDLQEALDSGVRGNLFESAPACGLFLDKVFYRDFA